MINNNKSIVDDMLVNKYHDKSSLNIITVFYFMLQNNIVFYVIK